MKRNKLFSIPYIIWMALFVVAPIVLVVLYAFTAADGGFTFANFTRMGNYFGVFVRSFWLALIATAICLVIGYPIAYLISKESKRFQRIQILTIRELLAGAKPDYLDYGEGRAMNKQAKREVKPGPKQASLI